MMTRESVSPLLLGLAVVWAMWVVVNLIAGDFVLALVWSAICAGWAVVGLSIRRGDDHLLTERELRLSIVGISVGVGFVLAVVAVFVTK
jgi:hypothetical protein